MGHGLKALALVALLAGEMAVDAAQVTYVVTDLGTFGGDTFVWGLNNSGQMSGYSYDTTVGQNRAFLYAGGSLINLGTFGGLRSVGNGINNSGQVVGAAQDAAQIYQAALWSDGTATNLGATIGSESVAIGINDSEHIVGYGVVELGAIRAYLYNAGNATDLGTLGGASSDARSVNKFGQVAGTSTTTTGSQHAYLYSNSKMTDLGTLPGSNHSYAHDINDSGQVVGGSHFDATGGPRAFLWKAGVMKDLGTLPGSPGSVAYAIGNSGVVVGATQGGFGSTGINHAVIWADGVAVDLNTLVAPIDGDWVLESATAINDSGQIAAFAKNSEGRTHAFLLDPVPGTVLNFSLKSPVVAGCKSVSGIVTLSGPAPAGGVVVTLSDTLASAKAPLSVKVLEGTTSKTFAIKTTPVAISETGTVSATSAGTTVSQSLTVRPMGMSAVTLATSALLASQDLTAEDDAAVESDAISPDLNVIGGKSATGTAKLECKAGPGPILVELSSTRPEVANPTVPSVVVPVGVQSMSFTVTTSPVAVRTKPAIKATANGITKSKVLTVLPP